MSSDLNLAHSPVRKLTWLYVVALSSIALMALAGQVLIQSVLARQKHDAFVVNIAGRQRMLSQKLSKSALALESPSDPLSRDARRRELGEVVKLWERSHWGLQLGDEQVGLPGENSPEVRRMFSKIEASHREMLGAAKLLLVAGEARDVARQVRIILENEATFLPGMDQIVFQYSRESGQRVERVERIEVGLLVITLLVLALEGAFVFRPAARRLRLTIEELWDTEDRLRREKATAERALASQSPTLGSQRARPLPTLSGVRS